MTLPGRLKRLADEMRAVAELIEARGRERDTGPHWRDAYLLMRHADEMRGAAMQAMDWARAIEREDSGHDA